jgi:uncharacterized phage protein (TIGR01671 family)
MREIKFRGMDANGVMRYGRLSQDKPNITLYYEEYSQRICWEDSNIPVSNKTLGQYTGLNDRNGKEIYEGDVLSTHPILGSDSIGEKKCNVVVRWRGCGWVANGGMTEYQSAISEVLGNIYENPELLDN